MNRGENVVGTGINKAGQEIGRRHGVERNKTNGGVRSGLWTRRGLHVQMAAIFVTTPRKRSVEWIAPQQRRTIPQSVVDGDEEGNAVESAIIPSDMTECWCVSPPLL